MGGQQVTHEHVRRLAGQLDAMEAELNASDAEYREAVARGDAMAAGVSGERFEYLLSDYERLVDRMTGSPLCPIALPSCAPWQAGQASGGNTKWRGRAEGAADVTTPARASWTAGCRGSISARGNWPARSLTSTPTTVTYGKRWMPRNGWSGNRWSEHSENWMRFVDLQMWSHTGRWRQRGITGTTEGNGGGDVAKTVKTSDAGEEGTHDVQALLDAAQGGDSGALETLKGQYMDTPRFWDALSQQVCRTEKQVLRGFVGEDMLTRELYERRLEAMRGELAGPAATPLEQLLADRIALCWLHVQHAELRYSQRVSVTLEQADHYQKCIDRAHKRYLSAIKTLATVRRLQVPALQVNIAEKQVNVVS